MTQFIIRRIIQAIPTFFGITLLSYLIIVAAPGDPVSILTFGPNVSPQEREAVAERLGVNQPWPMQYLRWLIGDAPLTIGGDRVWAMELSNGDVVMVDANNEDGEIVDTIPVEEFGTEQNHWIGPAGSGTERAVSSRDATRIIDRLFDGQDVEIVNSSFVPHYGATILWDGFTSDIYEGDTFLRTEFNDRYGILRGDFGNSFRLREPVIDIILDFLPASIELNVAVLIVGLGIGIPLGVLASIWHGSAFDQVTRVLAVIGNAIPDFWLALMFLIFFGATLTILPMGGQCAPTRGGCPPIWGRLEYLILPTTVLALGAIAVFSRFMRAAMLDTINSDYIRTARSKGLSPRGVWFRHAARNALIPMATFIGPAFLGVLFGGAVIIETIFTWPGIGRLTIQSITGQDYPVVMAVVVFGSVLTILGYLVTDILYAVLDPRIRF
ncbi:MAG: ABC transporter permease [Aggregatilineales bacterium]